MIPPNSLLRVIHARHASYFKERVKDQLDELAEQWVQLHGEDRRIIFTLTFDMNDFLDFPSHHELEARMTAAYTSKLHNLHLGVQGFLPHVRPGIHLSEVSCLGFARITYSPHSDFDSDHDRNPEGNLVSPELMVLASNILGQEPNPDYASWAVVQENPEE